MLDLNCLHKEQNEDGGKQKHPNLIGMFYKMYTMVIRYFSGERFL